jgi:hypothetical protein
MTDQWMGMEGLSEVKEADEVKEGEDKSPLIKAR